MSGTLAADGLTLEGADRTIVIVVLAVALLALVVSALLARWVVSTDSGTERMQEIASGVQEGASAFLARQFRTLALFGVIALIAIIALGYLQDSTTTVKIWRPVFFVIGALFSSFIAYAGMNLATRANVRVAAAARDKDGAPQAMLIAFRTGGVVGTLTVGLGLAGACIVVLAFTDQAPDVLEGFGFGAALLAMFIRVGGGIFTKAADVGADLVGKVEQGIPEDDPRNAATIADNVGDNVGDCAGMAADLFESYAVMLVATLILGATAFGSEGLVYPLLIPGVGVVTAILGVFITRLRKGDRNGMQAINRAFFITAVVSAIGCAVATWLYLPDSFAKLTGVNQSIAAHSKDTSVFISGATDPRIFAILAVISGIVLAAVIQVLTGYFTETNRRPVRDIAKTALTGPATVILSGITIGLESAVYAALVIAAIVWFAASLGGSLIILSLFAVALAGIGLLTTVGVIVAMDTFGPISDNAQGIAEMSGDIDEDGAAVLTSLDAVGNTTKAITKGIAIATAVLAATALFGAFTQDITIATQGAIGQDQTLLQHILSTFDGLQYQGLLNVADPKNIVGLLIGASVVFLFSGLAINAVSRAAGAIIFEVRRQFRDIPGIMEGTAKPEYGKVVDICTRDSLRELAPLGLLAICAPIAVGFLLGVGPLGAYLVGAIATGTLMAVFLANSGGAWDNSKKLVEDGLYGGKGSSAHEAVVIGDTVGDPFKDTAGPSINPLIKVMNLVSLLVVPLVVKWTIGPDANAALRATIGLVALFIIIGAIWISKQRSVAVGEDDFAAEPPEDEIPPTNGARVLAGTSDVEDDDEDDVDDEDDDGSAN